MAEVRPINAQAAAWLEERDPVQLPLLPLGPDLPPAIAALAAQQHAHGSVDSGKVEQAAAELGVSPRTVRRHLAAVRSGVPPRGRGSAFNLTDEHREVIFAHNGRVQAAFDDLKAQGVPLPDYKTFWRAWRREPAGVREFAKTGAPGARAKWVYARYEAEHRNAIWEADHVELPIDVIPDGYQTRRVKPWLTAFQDAYSRMIMGWAITAIPGRRPGSDVVIATLADAIRHRVEHGHDIGGVPLIVRWDQALEFLSGEVTQFAARVGFHAHAVAPYSGHLKGKVERLWLTIEQEFATAANGFTHGPTTYTGKQPFRDTPLMTATLLNARLATWVEYYNFERKHSSLGGRTPFEAFVGDTTKLRLVGNDKLRSALLVHPRTYKVSSNGVWFKRGWWIGSGILDLVDRKVEVHYSPTDDSFIEVYYEGSWYCTAVRSMNLTPAQRDQLLHERRQQYEESTRLLTAATNRRVRANEAAGADGSLPPGPAAMTADDPFSADLGDLLDLTGTDAQPAPTPPPAAAAPKRTGRRKQDRP